MKKITLFFILIALLNSCSHTETYYLTPTGIHQNLASYNAKTDTIHTIFYKMNKKIDFEEFDIYGKKDSIKWYKYYKNGELSITHSKGVFKDNGPMILFHVNGKVKAIGQYVNGKQEGSYKTFYDNGNAQCDCRYKNNKKDSIQRIYYENGQLETVWEYKEGLVWNILEDYDKQGSPREYGTLKDGNGTLIVHDEAGKVKKIIQYKNGKPK